MSIPVDLAENVKSKNEMRGTGVTVVGGVGLPDWESNPDLQGENLIS